METACTDLRDSLRQKFGFGEFRPGQLEVIEHLMAGHCTGIEPLVRLRTGLNLNRRTAVVGAVGSRFVYGEGIKPTNIAM